MLDFLKTMAIELEKKLRNAHMAFSTVTLKVMVYFSLISFSLSSYIGNADKDFFETRKNAARFYSRVLFINDLLNILFFVAMSEESYLIVLRLFL